MYSRKTLSKIELGLYLVFLIVLSLFPFVFGITPSFKSLITIAVVFAWPLENLTFRLIVERKLRVLGWRKTGDLQRGPGARFAQELFPKNGDASPISSAADEDAGTANASRRAEGVRTQSKLPASHVPFWIFSIVFIFALYINELVAAFHLSLTTFFLYVPLYAPETQVGLGSVYMMVAYALLVYLFLFVRIWHSGKIYSLAPR